MNNERSLLKQALNLWTKYGVMNKGDIIPVTSLPSLHSDSLFFSYELVYTDTNGSTKAAMSRKQLKMLVEMEEL